MERTLGSGQFYGEVAGCRRLSGFRITESTYAPGCEIPRHSHESAYFSVVLQGRYVETHGAGELRCGPRSLVFHPPGEVHEDTFESEGGRCLNVEVEPAAMERWSPCAPNLERSQQLTGGTAEWLAMRLQVEFRSRDAASDLALEGLALELLAESSRGFARTRERRPPLWLQEAREILHTRFAEPLSLEALAGCVDVHPVHLARTFRRHQRCTVGEYVRRLRVEFACHRLSESDERLVDIALAAGFCDQSHFCRTFRQITGMSPAKFRAARRGR